MTAAMVNRTCTLVRPDRSRTIPGDRPLASFEREHAYVLLGDPGAGKTTEFRAEKSRLGTQARCVTARNFRLHDDSPYDLPKGCALFIDGLDEIRAGTADPRKPFDAVRKLLLKLGCPKFRIACREWYWLGRNDRERLAYLVPDGEVKVLRLNPLTERDILQVLGNRFPDTDPSWPSWFVSRARQEGLSGLLSNPQSLGFLAAAVHDAGSWPGNRREVFDIACRAMANEPNGEHQIAARPMNQPTVQTVIDCAGWLCAVLLVSDEAGISLDADSRRSGYVPLEMFGDEAVQHSRATLGSRLFRAVPNAERCFQPVHRSVAEYLSGKRLAQLLAGGLSAHRVLALIAAEDGLPPVALSGLGAWLATFSEPARQGVIATIPEALGLHGDLGNLPPAQKEQVLVALLGRPWALRGVLSRPKRFVSLLSPATAPRICSELCTSDRSLEQAERVTFLLRLLSVPEGYDGLIDVIDQTARIARDTSWRYEIREEAVHTLVRYGTERAGGNERLRAVWDDLRAEGVSRSNCGLFGLLLTELYPEIVRPAEVWDYFALIDLSNEWNPYLEFWTRPVCDKSTDTVVEDLLDRLPAAMADLEPRNSALIEVPLRLLMRGLKKRGTATEDIGRISSWCLACSKAAAPFNNYVPSTLEKIHNWLEARPPLLQGLILAGREAFHGADTPEYADYGGWRRLLAPGFSSVPDRRKSLGRDESSGRPLGRHEAPTRGAVPSETRQGWQEPHTSTLARHRDELLEATLREQPRLLANQGDPGLLFKLALEYFGEGPDGPPTCRGQDAIKEVLRNESAIEAALHGLRDSILRDDLPSAKEVIGLAKQDKERHAIGLAVLAGLDMRDSNCGEFLLGVGESKLRTCVAILNCWEPNRWSPFDQGPDWYRFLLRRRIKLVAEVAVQCGASTIRSGGTVSPRFWEMLEAEELGCLEQESVLRLLGALPTRCNAQQRAVQDELAWKALRLVPQPAQRLASLVRRKLARRGLDIGQRIRWLCIGLLIQPAEHEEALGKAVRGRELRVRHVTQCFVHELNRADTRVDLSPSALDGLSPRVLALLARLAGQFFDPLEEQGQSELGPYFDSLENRASDLLHRVIGALQSDSSKSAGKLLEELAGEPDLHRWRDRLEKAAGIQRTASRNAEYEHPTASKVCEALRGGLPATAGDLAALTVERVLAIAQQIGTTDANEWRQYWNEGNHGKPVAPKVEAACRDAMRAALGRELPDGVQIATEVQKVMGWRVDMEISSQGFAIPIEVKRNSDANLWGAMQSQLIDKYTLDPASGGYGVYLVFWFGAGYQRQSPNGSKPEQAQELEAQLQSTLSGESRDKIRVCVIDVCPP